MPVSPDPITKVDPPANPAAVTDPPASPAVVDPAAKPSRPEWLGKPFDSYWSDDKGIDAAKLTTDFETLTAAQTAAAERAKAVPEKIDDYEVALPEGFELPEGMDPKSITFKADDPILKEVLPAIRQFAKDNNLTKDQFKGLVGLKTKLDLAEMGALKKAAAEQRALLGTKADEVARSVVTELTAALGNEHANALLPMMFTAKQVQAFVKLLGLVKGGSAAKPNGGGREIYQPEGMSNDDWDKLSPTQKISRGRELDAARQAK